MTHRGPTNWSTRDPAGLSYQERRVVELLRRGKSTAEICKAMSLARNSTYTYIARILHKTGTHSRLELVTTIGPWSAAATFDEEIDAAAERGAE